jgi:hypothetical protein
VADEGCPAEIELAQRASGFRQQSALAHPIPASIPIGSDPLRRSAHTRVTDWTEKYPAIAKAIAGLRAQNAYLDGELTWCSIGKKTGDS